MGTDTGPLYLGLDLSTQQLKAIIVSSDLHVVAEAKVDFDADFGAKYGVTKGVHVNSDEGEVYAPVAMWLESLDLVLSRLKEKSATSLVRVKGISGACQQHGSVYWSREAAAELAGLSTLPAGEEGTGEEELAAGLVERLSRSFSYTFGPNWQDHSTQAECDLFDQKLGSANKLADATGSAAHHRFTGPQIMRIRRKRPEVYANTAHISLVSSFLASLFLGSIAPIDISDACGMNLWDIPSGRWSCALLELAAGGPGQPADELRQKLGEVRADGGGSMGSVATYFVRRYGLPADCQVAPFTGDNPATILALPLRPLDAIVSLGTSSTFLMITPHFKPDPAYHFFNHPTTPGQYMFMLCYKNGGLAREKVRDALLPKKKPEAAEVDGGDPWAAFNKAVLATPPLGKRPDDDTAKLGLYFYLPEIVPNISAGTWRYACSASDDSSLREAAWDDAATDARIIVESQALSMRLRSRDLVVVDNDGCGTGVPSALPAQPRRIYLVGGGSLNPAIARVLGDVLGGAEGVYRLDVGGNACALGGAYKAVWAFERRDNRETFDELIGRRWTEEGAIQKVDDGYREGVFETYGNVLGAFEEMEKRILAQQEK